MQGPAPSVELRQGLGYAQSNFKTSVTQSLTRVTFFMCCLVDVYIVCVCVCTDNKRRKKYVRRSEECWYGWEKEIVSLVTRAIFRSKVKRRDRLL